MFETKRPPIGRFYNYRAKTLVKDSRYTGDAQTEMLRDTLVFGIASVKVRRDAISEGNKLTLNEHIAANQNEINAVRSSYKRPSDNNASKHGKSSTGTI